MPLSPSKSSASSQNYTDVHWSVLPRETTKQGGTALPSPAALLAIQSATAAAHDFDQYFDFLRDPGRESMIPKFDGDELELAEPPLRSIGYFTEYELIEIRLLMVEQLTNGSFGNSMLMDDGSRSRLADRCSEQPVGLPSCFAVKYVQAGLIESSDLGINAATEMILDAKILMNLAPHPNLCQIYGINRGGVDSFLTSGYQSFFVITDRIGETLPDRMNAWRNSRGYYNGDQPLPATASSRLSQRLEVALDIASALVYLHDRQLVFYLRPDKVGFDVRSRALKLCHFGQVRRQGMMTHARSVTKSDDLAVLAYTAPEVLCRAPATSSTDIYAFGILLWEMVTLEKPFDGLTRPTHFESVIRFNERPRLAEHWSPDLRKLIESCWNPRRRPTMKNVHQQLETALLMCEDDQDPFQASSSEVNKEEKIMVEDATKQLPSHSNSSQSTSKTLSEASDGHEEDDDRPDKEETPRVAENPVSPPPRPTPPNDQPVQKQKPTYTLSTLRKLPGSTSNGRAKDASTVSGTDIRRNLQSAQRPAVIRSKSLRMSDLAPSSSAAALKAAGLPRRTDHSEEAGRAQVKAGRSRSFTGNLDDIGPPEVVKSILAKLESLSSKEDGDDPATSAREASRRSARRLNAGGGERMLKPSSPKHSSSVRDGHRSYTESGSGSPRDSKRDQRSITVGRNGEVTPTQRSRRPHSSQREIGNDASIRLEGHVPSPGLKKTGREGRSATRESSTSTPGKSNRSRRRSRSREPVAALRSSDDTSDSPQQQHGMTTPTSSERKNRRLASGGSVAAAAASTSRGHVPAVNEMRSPRTPSSVSSVHSNGGGSGHGQDHHPDDTNRSPRGRPILGRNAISVSPTKKRAPSPTNNNNRTRSSSRGPVSNRNSALNKESAPASRRQGGARSGKGTRMMDRRNSVSGSELLQRLGRIAGVTKRTKEPGQGGDQHEKAEQHLQTSSKAAPSKGSSPKAPPPVKGSRSNGAAKPLNMTPAGEGTSLGLHYAGPVLASDGAGAQRRMSM